MSSTAEARRTDSAADKASWNENTPRRGSFIAPQLSRPRARHARRVANARASPAPYWEGTRAGAVCRAAKTTASRRSFFDHSQLRAQAVRHHRSQTAQETGTPRNGWLRAHICRPQPCQSVATAASPFMRREVNPGDGLAILLLAGRSGRELDDVDDPGRAPTIRGEGRADGVEFRLAPGLTARHRACERTSRRADTSRS